MVGIDWRLRLNIIKYQWCLVDCCMSYFNIQQFKYTPLSFSYIMGIRDYKSIKK